MKYKLKDITIDEFIEKAIKYSNSMAELIKYITNPSEEN